MNQMVKLILIMVAVLLLSGTGAASYSLTDTAQYDYVLNSKYIQSVEGTDYVVEMPIAIYKKGTDVLLATENTLLIVSDLGMLNLETERVDVSGLPKTIYSYPYTLNGKSATQKVTGDYYIISQFGINLKYKTVNEFASYLKTELQKSVADSSARIEYIDTTINGHRVIGVLKVTDDTNWEAGGYVYDSHRWNTFTYYIIREDFYPAGSGLAYFKLDGSFDLTHNLGIGPYDFPEWPTSQIDKGILEMEKGMVTTMTFLDSVIDDAATCKSKLIVGYYEEIYGGHGAGSWGIDTGAGGSGAVDYGVPLVVVAGIFAVGAAIAGVGAASGSGNIETERTSTYRMRIRKDFGDYIVCGKPPETLYAQMIETTSEGETIERDDLTASIMMSSGGGLIVEDPALTGGYMGAFISAKENELAEEGIVKVSYTGKGGSFTNNIHFRIIGEPSIKFPGQGKAMDMRLNVIYGDGNTYEVAVELVDFLEPPKDIKIRQADDAPFSSSLEETAEMHYTANIVNTSSLAETGAKVQSFPVWISAVREDDEIVEESFTVNFYPEGLSVTDVVYDKEGHAQFSAYDDADTEEDDVEKTGFMVNLVVRTTEDGKEIVKLIDGTDYAPEFGELKGTNQSTNVLVSKFEYTIEKKTDNTNKGYTFTPARQIGESKSDPHYVLLPISCDYGEETYALDLPVHIMGDKLGVRSDRETELALLKKRIRKFGINTDVAMFLRENVRNLSADELRLLSKKIVYDSVVYYQQESVEFMQTSESMDSWVTYLSIIKWFGDQAFSYLMTVYTGPAGEAILSPSKEIITELIGEVASDIFMGYPVNWNEVRVGVHVSEMAENYVMSCFEDIHKANPKKLAYVIAGLCIFNLVRHYSFDLDSDGKRSWYNAFLSAFSDISLAFLKNKFGEFFKGKIQNPTSGISKLMNSSVLKMLKIGEDGKLDVNLSGQALQQYLDAVFGLGASYVTEFAGKAAGEGFSVQVKLVTDSVRGSDWYAVVNPVKAVDKILEYVFTSLYETFTFPTANSSLAGGTRDPVYMNPEINQRIG